MDWLQFISTVIGSLAWPLAGSNRLEQKSTAWTEAAAEAEGNLVTTHPAATG
jgi:hypothetical protein